MRRLMFCAAFLCTGVLALAQSEANPSPAPTPSFGFSGPHIASSGSVPLFATGHSCTSINTPGEPQTDLNHIFHVPCLDLKSNQMMIARNEIPLIQPRQKLWPNAKSEPIPTQWPKAHIEQIPTQWPDVKMQSINGPAKTRP